MKKLLLATLFLSLLSCKQQEQSSSQNGNFKLEFLFEQNGCKMYRFLDGSRYIYWSDCSGKTQSDYTTSSGKSTVQHYEETITTK